MYIKFADYTNNYEKHAKERLWERFHIKLTPGLSNYIKFCIKTKKTLLDMEQPGYSNSSRKQHKRSAHVININGKNVPVVYDQTVNKIITILPNILALDWSLIK